MKYRKKPVVIEAMQFHGSSTNVQQVKNWMKTGKEPVPGHLPAGFGPILRVRRHHSTYVILSYGEDHALRDRHTSVARVLGWRTGTGGLDRLRALPRARRRQQRICTPAPARDSRE